MGNIVFWIMFFILIAVLIISTYLHERNKKAARREKIRDSFGDTADVLADDAVFDKVPSLLEYIKNSFPQDQCIDDITVNDLGLRNVYSRINRCVTSAGEAVMYCFLRVLCSDPERAVARYKKIRGFIDDPDRAVRLLFVLDGYRKRSDEDEFNLIAKLKDAKTRNIIYDILSLLLLAFALVLIAFYPLPGFLLTMVMLVVCIMGYFRGKRHMDDNIKGLALCLRLIRCAKELSGGGYEEFDKYAHLFALLRANRLIAYKDGTSSDPLSVIFDYVRMITHIDLITYSIKVEAVKRLTDELSELYIDIGKLDCLLSFASYLAGRDHCEATFTTEAALKALGMYHPLVAKPVCNDIDTKRPVLLTGSNASGKSTFLKAIGLNEIFAASFGFAFARLFETGVFRLYTSMALSDDLLAGESYYVVEARSIKRICDAAGSNRCLCMIDEILKGTNTTERIAASTQILKYLCSLNVLCFAATHDKELTDLLDKDMDMYHFTEEIKGENVTFPFVIQKGVSEKTNAITILSVLGFDPLVISSAEKLALQYTKTGKWSIEG